ncbi:hypothetical protein LptCag_2141 [Leptospirillum ferriphilum]|uniref:Uncharacterized protein n=1 Tax=Leptospirillum ferriphilum TaxID=178606 RepID=A0A094YN95_9BACT|nr:hypothetical protein LptCag_2141 [Leptospirillum ferriphilum]
MKRDKNLSPTVKIMTLLKPSRKPHSFSNQDSPVLHLSVTNTYSLIPLRKKFP